MNDQPNPAEFALAMYATACESHQRRDWREACHALAKALKAEQLASSSRATLATAAPMPAVGIPTTPAKRAKVTRTAKAGPVFDMTGAGMTAAMRLVCRAVERKGSIPIIKQVAMIAAGDMLTLIGTDLDMETRVTVHAPGVGDWTTTAGAHDLLALLAKADKAAPVKLALDDDKRLTVTIGRAATQLPTLPFCDFPTMCGDTTWTDIPADAPALLDGLRFVSPAISTEEVRYYLNGAYLHTRTVNGNRLTSLAGCDGHRLHLVDAPAQPGPDIPGMIIPRKAVALLLASMRDGADMTLEYAGVSPTHIRATHGPVTTTSKLIDGSFPDYHRIIPRESTRTMRADREGLAAALKSVASVCDDKARPVRLTMAGPSLTLQCRNTEGGKAEDLLEVDHASLESFEIGFNSNYLLDALASLDGEAVTLAMTDAASAATVTGANPGRLVVLMPLRV